MDNSAGVAEVLHSSWASKPSRAAGRMCALYCNIRGKL